MKFTIEIDPEVNPDAVGEYLRSAFFDEKELPGSHGGTYRETGCYNTFDWQKDVEPLEDIVVKDHTCEGCRKFPGHPLIPIYKCTCTDAGNWTRGKKRVAHVADAAGVTSVEIECRYYWDADGTLVFFLPGGQYLVNDDCKKDHDWYLTENPEDF